MSYNEHDVERLLRDSEKRYLRLRRSPLNKAIADADYVPEDPAFPNAYLYTVVSDIASDGSREAPMIDDMELLEAVVKRLKEIHGIADPWDREPEVYAEKWRKAHEARPQLSQEEWEKARQEEIAAAFAEEKARKKSMR